MRRDTIPVRAAAVSIVYGWLALLAFALAATAVRGSGHPGAPAAHKTTAAATAGDGR